MFKPVLLKKFYFQNSRHLCTAETKLRLKTLDLEHRAWVIALEHFLLGERQRPPPIDASECRMGSWLNLGGLDNHLDRNTVQSVQNTHHEVHDLAVQILAAHANKEAHIVSELLIKLYFKRDSLLKQLQILLTKVRELYEPSGSTTLDGGLAGGKNADPEQPTGAGAFDPNSVRAETKPVAPADPALPVKADVTPGVVPE